MAYQTNRPVSPTNTKPQFEETVWQLPNLREVFRAWDSNLYNRQTPYQTPIEESPPYKMSKIESNCHMYHMPLNNVVTPQCHVTTSPIQIQESFRKDQEHIAITQMSDRILKLKQTLVNQSRTIMDLQVQNEDLISNSNVTLDKLFQSVQRKRCNISKKRNRNSNGYESIPFKSNLIDESDQKSGQLNDNSEDFSVKWKGESYVLINAFRNRNQITNYFVPLFQSQYPDKTCKLVLSKEEYRQLFKENCHQSQSIRKHAWRISIFSTDFYNFVKQHDYKILPSL